MAKKKFDREAMRITVDYNNMMRETLGERGLTADELTALPLKAAAEAMRTKRAGMKWRELPHNQEEIVNEIEAVAKDVRANFDNFVVLGIGGSALGPIAVQQALSHLHYNDLPKRKRKGPRLFVEDNVDPERMNALLDVIDVKKTCFNVITNAF